MKKKSIFRRIHFIGIGGIGMSALARYFLALKARISGSDVTASEICEELKKEGAEIKIGHKKSNITPKIGLVIHSAAIKPDNPEIVKARKLGIPIKPYSEVVGELTKKYKTIAVSGSHGKSTTTALLSLVLMNTRFDPTVIVGAKLKEFANNQRKSALSSNFRKGKSDYLVLEADEYQKSFLNYSPVAAIITNIDREHLDVYKNLNNVKKVFLKFIGNICRGGILVVNKDDKNLFGLKNKIQKIAEQNNIKLFWYSIKYSGHPMSQILTKNNFRTSDVQKLKRILKVAGEHNLSNALAAYTLARALGVNRQKILNAISKYRGAWRRMEYKGRFKIKDLRFKIDVYDDYAHHPTEIKATLSGLRQKYPKSRIICVFQPHQARRLKSLFKEFSAAFDTADDLILLNTYEVAGREGLWKSRFNSFKLAEVIQRGLKRKNTSINTRFNTRLNSVIHLSSSKNLSKILKKIIPQNQHKSAFNRPKSILIIMMGAGDIYRHTSSLLSLNNKRKSKIRSGKSEI